MQYDILIVGSGHAGAQTAIALRQHSINRTIAILGDEPYPPYERPPLSKEYLTGDKAFDRILIRPEKFWAERSVTLLPSRRATEIDPAAKLVRTDAGDAIRYGDLVWATGGRPRRLTCAGHDLAGVHYMRTRHDSDTLMRALPRAERIVVIGGGYIGLETASALAKLGKHITVLEFADRVLARVAGAQLSHFYEAEHRAHGVDLRLNTGAAALVGQDGRVTGVRLVSGETLAADLVVAGIGIEPAVEPLLAAGAAGGNGVAVDAHCRTSLDGIYAVGDCALHKNAFADADWIRLESVQNANDMAETAAASIIGVPTPYAATPWFWSNQYDLRLQTIGLSLGHDQTVLRGNPRDRRFSVIYLRNGQVCALDCVNSVKDYAQGRALVETRARIAPELLADTTRPLKTLAEAMPAANAALAPAK